MKRTGKQPEFKIFLRKHIDDNHGGSAAAFASAHNFVLAMVVHWLDGYSVPVTKQGAIAQATGYNFQQERIDMALEHLMEEMGSRLHRRVRECTTPELFRLLVVDLVRIAGNRGVLERYSGIQKNNWYLYVREDKHQVPEIDWLLIVFSTASEFFSANDQGESALEKLFLKPTVMRLQGARGQKHVHSTRNPAPARDSSDQKEQPKLNSPSEETDESIDPNVIVLIQANKQDFVTYSIKNIAQHMSVGEATVFDWFHGRTKTSSKFSEIPNKFPELFPALSVPKQALVAGTSDEKKSEVKPETVDAGTQKVLYSAIGVCRVATRHLSTVVRNLSIQPTSEQQLNIVTICSEILSAFDLSFAEANKRAQGEELDPRDVPGFARKGK